MFRDESKMMKKVATFFIVIAVLALIVLGFRSVVGRRREGVFYAMGGIPVRVVAHDRTASDFDSDLREVESSVDRLEAIFSRHRADGDLARLNAVGMGCVEDASSELIDLLRRSRRWSDMTGGAFDVTVGPLVSLWKEAERKGSLPAEGELMVARERVGMENLKIEGDSVCLDRPGMSVDLGAIAKGAIIDEAVSVLRRRGVARGLVDAGGDVASFGEGEFRIGIQDPRDREKLMGAVSIGEGGVVTSGDYERYATIGGKRYSHIVDPRTGEPAEGPVSVTVIGPNATDADALATAISVMGREKGGELLEKLPSFKALIVERRGDGSLEAWSSEGLAASGFSP
jgi:thiamine biosynthesis lipoprotein